MPALVRAVVSVSLGITPVILLLLALVPWLRRRYHARWRCAVWELAALRLLVPFRLPIAAWLPHAAAPGANLLRQIDNSQVLSALRGLANAEARPEAAAIPDIWQLAALVWLAGAVLFLGGHLLAYGAAMHRLHRWRTPVTDPAVQQVYARAKNRLGIRTPVRLWVSSGTQVPLLTGLLRPCIYLPVRALPPVALADVLTHELYHYQCRDLWRQLALLLANAVHWFNPAVYVLLCQCAWDREMACDSAVLNGATVAARQQYGLTILSFARTEKTKTIPLTTCFYGGNKQMKMRFSDILGKNKTKTGLLMLLLLAGLLTLGGARTVSNAAKAEAHDTTAAVQEMPPEIESGIELEMEDDALPVSHGDGTMAWPVPGIYDIAVAYGWRYDGADFHTGMDIGGADSAAQAAVTAAQAGTVVGAISSYTGYGQYIVLDHGSGITTLYAHLGEMLVSTGEEIAAGQEIGKVGRTGNTPEYQLHFEVRENGVPVDPVPYLMPSEE